MIIAIGSDHAGYEEKELLKPLLAEAGCDVIDVGTDSVARVDYPDFARAVAEDVAAGRSDAGILICASGTGMAIAANKVPGIRAAVAWNQETARLSKQHNNANVLAIGSRTTPAGTIPGIIRAWLSADFEGGRHDCRIRKIEEIEHSAIAEQEKQ